MSDQDANLFSEVQLSQVATMMPYLLSKVKEQAHDQHVEDETNLIGASGNLKNSNQGETQQGLLRLAAFLKKSKNKNEPPADPAENKVIAFRKAELKKIANSTLAKYLAKRAAETYAWVQSANRDTEYLAVELDKHL